MSIDTSKSFKETNLSYFHNYYVTRKVKYVVSDKNGYKKRYSIINSYKNKPCNDCGIQYNPWQMDFDHRDGEVKVGNISSLKRLSQIETEITKCDLVCLNCHRNRTYQRMQKRKTYYV